MYKNIITIVLLYKTIPFFFIKPLHSSLCQDLNPLIKCFDAVLKPLLTLLVSGVPSKGPALPEKDTTKTTHELTRPVFV